MKRLNITLGHNCCWCLAALRLSPYRGESKTRQIVRFMAWSVIPEELRTSQSCLRILYLPAIAQLTDWKSNPPTFSLGHCMGTWKHIGARTCPALPRRMDSRWYPWRPNECTLRVDGNYIPSAATAIVSTAPYDQKFFDAIGNLVFEDTATIHATRLSVDQSADQSDASAIK